MTASPIGENRKVTSFRSRVSGLLAALRRLLVPLLVVLAGAVIGAVGTAVVGSFGWRMSPSALAGHGTPLNAQRVYDRIAPSVLDITAVLRYDDETAEGTGFVMDSRRALVLTNNHVIRHATSITATIVATGKTYTARLVGADTAADIAVLRLDGRPRLPAAPAGDSSSTRLGDQVLVIGNQAGQGGAPTIAPGIINSLDRTIVATNGDAGFSETLRGMLQTSAQVEPGDSGGPLANADGQVIGVDTAAATGATTAGFAIPVDSALAAARRIASGRPGPGIALGTGAFLGILVSTGQITPQSQPQSSLTNHGVSLTPQGGDPIRAFAGPKRARGLPGRGAGTGDEGSCLGIESEAAVPDRVAPVRSGVLVEGVLCNTPAETTGLAPGDMIVAAAGRRVASPGALASIVAGCQPGTTLPVTWVDVNGATRTALVRAAAAPAP
ncbi:MAG: serine protease [Nocardiopsaceae bacterium]|nr:serine protease [Nocardiopsaceae bacterium]